MDLIAFHVWKFIVVTKLCWRSRDLTGYLYRRERPFLQWILIMLLMLNLLVVCNKLVSSFWLMLSYGFWHFHHPYLLASSVLCIAFCSHWELCILRQYIQPRGRTFSCSPTHKPIHLPQNSHHTYLPQHFHSCFEIYCHATSILHYMTCCHLSFIYCFAWFYTAYVWFTHVTLDHCISCYTGRGI